MLSANRIVITVLMLCSFACAAEKPPLPPSEAPWANDPNKDKIEVGPNPTSQTTTQSTQPKKLTDAQKTGLASIGLLGIGLLILGVLFYFLPTVIANSNKHHNTTAIFLVNLFFGWSFFGWIIALIWAFTKPPPRR